MSKREKMIVVAMVIAVAYEAFSFLFDSSAGKKKVMNSENSKEELNKFVLEVAGKLTHTKASDLTTYALARAKSEAGWENNLFIEQIPQESLEKEVMAAEEEALSVLEAGLKYSGFVIMGEKSFAVINGMEYRVGEELDQGGYFVHRISPIEVEIKALLGEESAILPLEETY